MSKNAQEAFEKASLGTENKAYAAIAKLDPEYFEKLKGIYVDATFGREGALPRKTKELIMIGITCALNRPRGVRLHCERALALGVSPREVLEAVEVATGEAAVPGWRAQGPAGAVPVPPRCTKACETGPRAAAT